LKLVDAIHQVQNGGGSSGKRQAVAAGTFEYMGLPVNRGRARNRWRTGGAVEAETHEIEEFNAPIFRLQPAWILIFYEGLKIPRGKTRAGSIPASGTIS
jgi:hypothetical protein